MGPHRRVCMTTIPDVVSEEFGPLRGLIGQRFYEKVDAASSPEGGASRIVEQTWSLDMDGEIIRVEERSSDGSRQLLTLIYQRQSPSPLGYVTFTSNSEPDRGEIRFNRDGSWTAETSEPDPSYDAMRTTGRIMSDGSLMTETTLLRGSQWVPGPGARFNSTLSQGCRSEMESRS